jgi:hypothetical protein
MNIVFDQSEVEELKQKYILLTLDTFVDGDKQKTAFCLIENIPINELPEVEHNLKLHNNLLDFYAQQRWDDCLMLLDALFGKWGGEADSFYLNLKNRISVYQMTELPASWSPFLTARKQPV